MRFSRGTMMLFTGTTLILAASAWATLLLAEAIAGGDPVGGFGSFLGLVVFAGIITSVVGLIMFWREDDHLLVGTVA